LKKWVKISIQNDLIRPSKRSSLYLYLSHLLVIMHDNQIFGYITAKHPLLGPIPLWTELIQFLSFVINNNKKRPKIWFYAPYWHLCSTTLGFPSIVIIYISIVKVLAHINGNFSPNSIICIPQQNINGVFNNHLITSIRFKNWNTTIKSIYNTLQTWIFPNLLPSFTFFTNFRYLSVEKVAMNSQNGSFLLTNLTLMILHTQPKLLYTILSSWINFNYDIIFL
jgi:hypothetical protein